MKRRLPRRPAPPAACPVVALAGVGGDGRQRREGGFLGGLDALAFGALVFVTGTLLVVNAWSVVDTRMAVGAAARDAARTIAGAQAAAFVGPDVASKQLQLAQAAQQRAADALTQHGKDLTGWNAANQVSFTLPVSDPRCAVVTATVAYRAQTIALPFVGAFWPGGVPVSVTHRERIDPYRAGLPGEASCA